MELLSLIVTLVCSLPQILAVDSKSTSSVSWSRPGLHSHQSLHSVLVNLEERLRTLDSIRYSTTRWELSLDALNRRIESLESRLTRAQTALQLKLDTLSQTIVSCELKDDLAREQFTRKFEASQERVLHRLGYLETRLDSAINKLQGSVEVGFGKLENKGSDIDTELANIGSTVNEIKSHSIQWEEKTNQTQKAVSHLSHTIHADMITHRHMDKITNMLHGIHKHVNKSNTFRDQNDGPNIFNKDEGRLADVFKIEIGNEAQKLTSKVNNMYNDLWRKILSMEELIRKSMIMANVTQKEVREEIRSLFDSRDAEANDDFIEVLMESLASMIQRKISDLNRKVDNNFQRVLTAQTMFMESCHRLQEDEPLLETKVSLVLEKILDTIINRTANVDKQIVELFESLKAHNSQVIRTITHSTNTVITLAEENSQDHKYLNNVIMDTADRTETFLQAYLQEFHDQVQEEMNETMSKYYETFKTLLTLNQSKPIKSTQITNTINNNTNKDNMQELNLNMTNFETVHVVDANYNEGVLKILTEIIPTNDTSFSNRTEMNMTLEIPINLINKTLNVDYLTAIVNEPKPQGTNLTSVDNQNVSKIIPAYKTDTQKTLLNKPNVDNHDIIKEKQEESNIFTAKSENINSSKTDGLQEEKLTESHSKNHTEQITESTAINLMMLYMKVLKGHLTKAEFLQEANPSQKYENIQELIVSIKGSKFIPKEFLRDLDNWDRSESGSTFHLQTGGNISKNLKESLVDDYNYEDFYESDSIT